MKTTNRNAIFVLATLGFLALTPACTVQIYEENDMSEEDMSEEEIAEASYEVSVTAATASLPTRGGPEATPMPFNACPGTWP